MKKDKQQSSFVNIGSSSLLIIFLILSLVAFAVLSLASAHSDYKLTGQLAEHKAEYYQASVRAEQVLSRMDEVFEKQADASGKNLEEYQKTVADELLSEAYYDDVNLTCTNPDKEDKNVLLELRFTIPMSKKQVLEVALQINDYTQADTYYEVKAWQVISTESWEGDQTIQLLPIEE